mgnify:FL=1
MPELPEVEVVKRSLESKIINSIIKKVQINDHKLRYKVKREIVKKLTGKKIKKIKRRSKFLIFEINKTYLMLVHLGMTGKFFLEDRNKKKFKTSFYYLLDYQKDQKHNRVIFFLSKNRKLIYNDVRKFGFIKLYKFSDYIRISHLKNLGPEPLEKKWNFKYFKNYIVNKKRNIKNILMDQRFVSGLGNIYVNEILFLSGVRPCSEVKELKDFKIKKIIKNSKMILKKSIKLGGSTIKDFSSENGKKGVFQEHLKIYGRKGKKCSNVDCNTNIVRIVISNRATFFCKKCQK